MIKTLNPQKQKLKINYSGELDSIDADTYLKSLTNLTEVIKEINRLNNLRHNADRKLEIKISSHEKGSFEVEIALVASFIENLFSTMLQSDNVEYVYNIVHILVGCFLIKKFFSESDKAQVEQTGDEVEIKDSSGDKLVIDNVTYNIFTQSENIDKNISKNFEALEKDEQIKKFRVEGKEEKHFEARRKDFHNLSRPLEEEEDSKTELKESVELVIVKLGFERTYKWDFYYGGQKISAWISDESFFEDRISKGDVSFSKGDRIIADLEIEKIYEPKVDTYIDKRYYVCNIKEHIPLKHKQMGLFDEPNHND